MLLVFALIAGSACPSGGVEPSVFGKYRGPRSLGIYDLDHDRQMKSVLAALGTQPTGKDIYCFEDKEHGTYLYVRSTEGATGRVARVLLSSFPNCKNLPIHSRTIDPKTWRTPEGIGLASTTEEVSRAYGKPVSIRKIGNHGATGVIADPKATEGSQFVGDTRFLYSCLLSEKEGCADDLRSAKMGFDKGKLIWISLSNSE